MDTTKNIKAKIKQFREERNLTQEQMAEMLCMGQPTYSKLETGKTEIKLASAIKLAEIFRIELSELINDKENQWCDFDLDTKTPQQLKKRIKLSEKIICSIKAEIEVEIMGFECYYDGKYMSDLTYNQYLTDEYSNPAEALKNLKEELAEYKKNGAKRYAIYDINFFLEKDDNLLLDFLKKEENYPFVHGLLFSPEVYATDEDYYNMFKEMITANPFMRSIFNIGLLQDSYYSKCWERYIKEKPQNQIVNPKLKDQLKDIYGRHKYAE